MPEKFLGKYRIPSSRAFWWDYSKPGSYFVTINTKNQEFFFGNVINGEMQLSETGKIAHQYWIDIPKHFPFVKLGAFIVMPNHVHGIVVIMNGSAGESAETLHATSLLIPAQENKNIQMAKISPVKGSLGSVIRSYKSAVSRDVRKIISNFNWQARYFDSIIRDQQAYRNITAYILNNPSKWIDSRDFFYII